MKESHVAHRVAPSITLALTVILATTLLGLPVPAFAGLYPEPPWTDFGSRASELHGFSVTTAGDVNGDGFSDVIVGSPLGSKYGDEALVGSAHRASHRPRSFHESGGGPL